MITSNDRVCERQGVCMSFDVKAKCRESVMSLVYNILLIDDPSNDIAPSNDIHTLRKRRFMRPKTGPQATNRDARD